MILRIPIDNALVGMPRCYRCCSELFVLELAMTWAEAGHSGFIYRDSSKGRARLQPDYKGGRAKASVSIFGSCATKLSQETSFLTKFTEQGPLQKQTRPCRLGRKIYIVRS